MWGAASEPFHIHIVVPVAIVIAPAGIAQTNRLGLAGLFGDVVAHITDITGRKDLKDILGQMAAERENCDRWVLKHTVLLSQWELNDCMTTKR